MIIKLKIDKGMKLIGTNSEGMETEFDSSVQSGGGEAPTPMEILLEAMAACSTMDVIAILKKKRKTIFDLQIEVEGEKAETHPKVFTKVHLNYNLYSNDAELNDLESAVELTQTKYCGASAMFQKSGCEVSWSCQIIKY